MQRLSCRLTGAMFIATMFIGCLNACLVQPVMYVERTVFYRERAAGAYGSSWRLHRTW